MKNHFFQFTLAILASLFFTLTACEKDDVEPQPVPTLNSKLAGHWDITSFTLNGIEVKGTIVTASDLELKPGTGVFGTFEWDINYSDGTRDKTSGDYVVNEAKREITFDASDGDIQQLKFDLEGDELELYGTMDGDQYLLKASRD